MPSRRSDRGGALARAIKREPEMAQAVLPLPETPDALGVAMAMTPMARMKKAKKLTDALAKKYKARKKAEALRKQEEAIQAATEKLPEKPRGYPWTPESGAREVDKWFDEMSKLDD